MNLLKTTTLFGSAFAEGGVNKIIGELDLTRLLNAKKWDSCTFDPKNSAFKCQKSEISNVKKWDFCTFENDLIVKSFSNYAGVSFNLSYVGGISFKIREKKIQS